MRYGNGKVNKPKLPPQCDNQKKRGNSIKEIDFPERPTMKLSKPPKIYHIIGVGTKLRTTFRQNLKTVSFGKS